MKEIYCSPRKILPREAEREGLPNNVSVKTLPPIAVFEVDQDYEFRREYDIEYVCINGHRRLYAAKKRRIKSVRIIVPENIDDLETLAKNKEWPWALSSTYEENRTTIIFPGKIKKNLFIFAGVSDISQLL